MADFLEILILHGEKSSFADLADLVADKFGRKQQILLMEEEEKDDDDEDGDDFSYADAVVACVRERVSQLGVHYPFVDLGTTIALRSGLDPLESPYLCLLGITALHAYGVPCPHDVTQIFESVVTSCLRRKGYRASDVGDLSRKNGSDFGATTVALGAALGVEMNHRAVPRRKAANDGGIDVLAFVDWEDGRLGRWVLIGQATCGSSNDWESKAGEPSLATWRKIMGEVLDPTVFLAVPHHVDLEVLRYLSARLSKAVLDRVRLTRMVGPFDSTLRSVTQSLLDASVQSLRV